MNNNKSYLKNYKNLKILITGSTGFKGSWLSQVLLTLGANVIGVGLKPEKGSKIFSQLNLNRKIKQHYLDIRKFSKVNDIIKKEKPDIIFHLAAQSIVSHSYEYPLETFETNIIGSANILESVKKNKIPNLVYITSDKCYLNLERNKSYNENDILGGIDNYSSSKACAELIFKSYINSYFSKSAKHSIVSARAGNVIGGGDFKNNRIIPDVVKSISKNRNIVLRSPNSTRPWQHVLEPLSGYLLLGKKILNREIKKNINPSWNFGPYEKNCKTVKELANLSVKRWNNNKIRIVIKNDNNFHESKLLSLNINKAKKELNWKPTLTLSDTINLTIDWYKNYYNKKDMEKFTIEQIEYFRSI